MDLYGEQAPELLELRLREALPPGHARDVAPGARPACWCITWCGGSGCGACRDKRRRLSLSI